MATSGSSLESSTSRTFSSKTTGVTVPVEIVDTTSNGGASTTVLEQSGPPLQDGLSQDDSMEISLEEISQHASGNGQSLADTLTARNGGMTSSKNIEDIVLNVPSVDSTQLTPLPPSAGTTNTQHDDDIIQPSCSTNMTPTLSSSASLGLSLDTAPLDAQLALQQVSQHFQEISRSLRNEGIEISPETLASHFPQSLVDVATLIGGQSSTGPNNVTASLLDSVINQSTQGLTPMDINYSDLTDVGRVINNPNLTSSSSSSHHMVGTQGDDIDAVLGGEPHVPSSPDSNFDTSDLLNNTLTHDVELTAKLASAGPVGVAAAAAILSGRKRRKHVFESNPALRKRHCSKLMRKLKETLDELSTRVGLQACVVTYRPSSKQEKPEPSFKVFGTSPLLGAVEEQRGRIIHRMDEQLKKQIPPTPPSSSSLMINKQNQFELPPLVFEGIPAPVNEMTQAQLRGFIPSILKYSTGRGKPGWGKDEMKPVWWPVEVPWQNVRSDVRNEAQKKTMSWTECLRKTVIACYTHHGRQDLLHAAIGNKTHVDDDDDIANNQQLQLHLEAQHSIDLSSLQDHVINNDTVNGLEPSQDQVHDQQQVFTIDTGMGNCDTSGMPTLADASLAETAARLQQVADETGQVQYATQTVTVTERDSKALGQPVGSTTTVLLTAYPSGQTVGDGQQQYYQSSTTTTTGSTANNGGGNNSNSSNSSTGAPSVQVVYSASHISDMSTDTITSHTPQELYTSTDTNSGPNNDNNNVPSDQSLADSTDYFTRAPIDLASEYISGYTGPPKTDVLTSDHHKKELNNNSNNNNNNTINPTAEH